MTTEAAAPVTTAGSAPAPTKLAKPTLPFHLPRPEQVLGQDDATELVILPDPTGYSMLIALPTMAQQTASGIWLPQLTTDQERAAAVVGVVLAQGPQCYKDPRKFGVWDEDKQKFVLLPPWCKVGDTIMFARYSGMRFKTRDIESGDLVEYRMLSDDMCTGTVPEGAHVEGL